MQALSSCVSVKRRYSRSVNLERDIEIPDSVIGYLPTARAIDVLERLSRASSLPHSVRAWTLTGSYGTGKSAFANYLTSLFAPKGEQIQLNALQIIKQVKISKSLLKQISDNLPESGLVRAVATAQREPVVHTIIRALDRGASIFWQKARGRRPDVLKDLRDLHSYTKKGVAISSKYVVEVIEALAQASKTGILLIIDELGKNLEYSAKNQSSDDLYLLQQLAELPSQKDGYNLFLFGLLHQSFSDYAHGLASAQRNEWSKIQGRFEDIPFMESSDRMIRLIAHAMDRSNDKIFQSSINRWAKRWHSSFSRYAISSLISKDDLAATYPLHPFSALVLPILCTKFSQNDRTLFTFLTSGEPDSFSTYLEQNIFKPDNPPTFKLNKIYDYFVESAGMSISHRLQFQRWVEIQSRLADANHLDSDVRSVLKTIGLLNLISTTGILKASRKTIALALCDSPNDDAALSHWDGIIDELLNKGFVTWRKSIDEIRIWEGSDFDIEKEITDQSQIANISLADLLNDYFPLRPLVIHRHSYETGTLRYFERHYWDGADSIKLLKSSGGNSDGLIVYWVGKNGDFESLKEIPEKTSDNKPIVVVCASELDTLQITCHEYVALRNVEANASQLQTDGVARREVNQRILHSRKLLEESLSRSLDIASSKVTCYALGQKIKFSSWSSFQNYLSKICDTVYKKGPCLWNELINRREVTAQGSAARRMLIEVMLENAGQKRLGLTGNGPEYSMFESVLHKTGLYAQKEDGWVFAEPPEKENGIYHVWKAIESFCLSARNTPKSIDMLYDELEAPPYGVKAGMIPIILLSVLLNHSEYISIYVDGTFIPVLGPEHFELLVKRPNRFAVKYYEVLGIKAAVLNELARILSSEASTKNTRLRNATILSVVRPLFGFINRLPTFSLNTENWVSQEAKAVRNALWNAKEPDHLLFVSLPEACGVPFGAGKTSDVRNTVRLLRKKLVQALKSLQTAYDDLLIHCEKLIREAFVIKIDSNEFRENLRSRATNLLAQVIEPRLKSFILASAEKELDHKYWLESLLLIISNKPPESWTDEDVIIFETKLSDIARRFMNLEALQREIAIPKEGIDVRRVTVTYPDGDEIHQMVWIDREDQENIDRIAEKIIENFSLDDDANLKQAVTAALIEKILSRRTEKLDSGTERQIKEYKIG